MSPCRLHGLYSVIFPRAHTVQLKLLLSEIFMPLTHFSNFMRSLILQCPITLCYSWRVWWDKPDATICHPSIYLYWIHLHYYRPKYYVCKLRKPISRFSTRDPTWTKSLSLQKLCRDFSTRYLWFWEKPLGWNPSKSTLMQRGKTNEGNPLDLISQNREWGIMIIGYIFIINLCAHPHLL